MAPGGSRDFSSVRDALGGRDFHEQLRWMEENPPDLPSSAGGKDSDVGVASDARCPRCGGLIRDDATEAGRHCRCDGPLRRCRELVDRADPTGSMAFGSLEASDPTLARAAALAREVAVGKRRGLAMFGMPGTGKTHTAVAACREAIGRGEAAAYHNVVALVSRIQETYGADWHQESRTSVIAGVAGRDLVVLDDLGKERTTEDVQTIVYELVDGIYSSGARLIVCSNLTPPEYKARYDEAVTSRIAGACEILAVRGADRRRSG